MKPSRNVLQTVAAAGLLITAAGCAPTATATAAGTPAAAAAPAPATPEMIAEGRSLFSGQGRCAVCHGQGGRGGQLGPNLQDDEWIWVDPSQPIRPQVEAIIRNGIETPREHPAPMPAMGGGALTPDQVPIIAAFVESL